MQMQFDTYSIHSGSLYQIFTYVKNKEVELSDKLPVVSDLLEIRYDEAYPERAIIYGNNGAVTG